MPRKMVSDYPEFQALSVFLGITFNSISADGGMSGIFLGNTSGSFTVSGGTIQNTIEDGIYSKDAEGVRLRDIDINNSGRHGLMRLGAFIDLDAENIRINGSASEGVFVQLNLNSEYQNNSNNSGLRKVSSPQQSINKFSLKNSQILNTGLEGVKVQTGGTDSLEVTITGNTVTTPSDVGLTVQTSDSGFALVELSNNSVTADSIDFQLVQDSTSTFALLGFAGGDSAAVVAFVQNNNVGTPRVSVKGKIRAETVTSVSGPDEPQLPTKFALEQNYPNPFNPTTTIRFSIPFTAKVTLKLFDLLGREVATLVDEELQPNSYNYQFEANALASGIYFYQLQATGSDQQFIQTKKLTLVR
ncbi:MAG: T9SS type A sorting domain-containing protein [bacterium]